MPITVVLADGFDDQDVELLTNDQPYVLEDVSTSLLTGVAAELEIDADGDAQVSARIVRGHGAKADPQPDDVLPEHRQAHAKDQPADDGSDSSDDGSDPPADEASAQPASRPARTASPTRPVEAKERPAADAKTQGARTDQESVRDTPRLATFDVPDGATLVLIYDERGISGTVHTEPVMFG